MSRRLLLLLALIASGCRTGAPPEGAVRLDLDARDPDRLLGAYFGGYLGPEGGDPFAAGLIERRGTERYLLPSRLPAPYRDAFAAPDGVLDADALADAVHATYPLARQFPPTLDAFRQRVPYGGEGWFVVEKDGVMTTARRRIYVAEAALRAALAGYRAAGDQLLYPVGTAIVGEHWLDGARAETTVMQKRPDGSWDFWVYGAEGALAPATDTPPRPLRAPVQCVGCHVGQRQFEPEASFPAAAPPGPHGPRAVHVPEAWRDAEVTQFFDEHTRRSDTALGLYATLFVGRLREEARQGRIEPEDAAMLDGLGLLPE